MFRLSLAVLFAWAVTAVPAEAVTLATCPDSGNPDRVFAIDQQTVLGVTVTCFAYGDTNNITGGNSDTFLSANDTILDFIDYDGPPNSTDNFYFYTVDSGTTSFDGFDWVTGTFNFGSEITSVNTTLYVGFKTGQNIDPVWAVFKLTDFSSGTDLVGTYYIRPPEGSGVSHSSIYGDTVPPGATPDPAVPEPTSMLLLGTGLLGAAAAARRRRRARRP